MTEPKLRIDWRVDRIVRDSRSIGQGVSNTTHDNFPHRLEEWLNVRDGEGYSVYDICIGAKDAVIIFFCEYYEEAEDG